MSKGSARRQERSVAAELKQIRSDVMRRYRTQTKRNEVAAALRMIKCGASVVDVERAVGWRCNTGPSLLREYSKQYRKKTQATLMHSTWHADEAAKNHRSQTFRKEEDFREHAAAEMAKVFDVVEQEVGIHKTRRRIDIVVSHGLFRFGVELKNGNRTARLDQTLGQALIKCASLDILPVCAIPDDVHPDEMWLYGCDKYGVIAGRLSGVIREMCAKCCISTR